MFSINELMAIQEALLLRISRPDDEMLLEDSATPLAQDYQLALSTVNMLIERIEKEARVQRAVEAK